MRGFFAGIFLVLFVLLTVLSLRPGGLRSQLRQIARRFKLALVLTGVYLAASTVLRVAFPTSGLAEIALVVLALGLCVTFLVLSPDQPLDQR